MAEPNATHPPKIPDLRATLLHGEFAGLRMHPSGSNTVFDALLEGPAGQVRAIYKPCSGEAPLYDFPDGTLYRREYAAYLLDQALGWGYVPTTVVREGPHGIGMVQLYVDHDAQANYFTLRGSHRTEFARLAAFDILTNNADRKGSHCLLGTDGRVWAIDHGLTFHALYKLRTVIWDFQGQEMDAEIVEGLTALRPHLERGGEIAAQLDELLDRHEMGALRGRLDALLESPVYPYPGPGRSVPWPPI